MSGFKYVRDLNVRKFLLIWQGSEYALGCNHGKVLNIPGFQVCQVFAYTSVAQDSEYAWIMQSNALWQGSEYACSTFHSVSNKPLVLNILELRIWQVCEYARVTQVLNKPKEALLMSEYALICLNDAECDWIYRHKPGKKHCSIWILNVSDTVHSRQGHCTNYWPVIEIETHSEHCQTFKMKRFAKIIMTESRCGTRHLSGH